MELRLAVQYAVDLPGLPCEALLRRWSEAALRGRCEAAELTIRVVDTAESSALNQTYRHKQGPTNVLAFAFEAPVPAAGLASNLLGDIVICAPVVAREAVIQGKAPAAHWAHMVIHGILHLLGYDHQEDTQAREMENLEVQILVKLGYSDPYEVK